MVDWVSGMADASVAERDSGFILVRVPGSPDVLKETPISGFVTKNASGDASISSGLGTRMYWDTTRSFGVNRNFEVAVDQYSEGQFTITPSTALGGATFTTPVFAINASGAVGFGVPNPTARVHIGRNGDGVAVKFGSIAYGMGALGEEESTNTVFVANGYTASRLSFRVNGTASTNEVWSMTTSGHFLPYNDNLQDFGSASKRGRTAYFGTGAINTSDERAKTDIGEIPDAWLDAWAGVEWCRFKMLDRNRWHVGLVAQQVHAAFAAHDLDAFEIGLCCFDAWDEVREKIFETVTKTREATRTEQVPAGEDENGEPLFKLVEVAFDEEYEENIDTGKTRVTLEAGDRWGLRYDECQAIEAAFQRRALAHMAARLAALEN